VRRFDLTCGQTPDKRFNPASRAGVAQLVERVLAKHEVVGSKPITRSIKITRKLNQNRSYNAIFCSGHYTEIRRFTLE
jgi:hypothetical protein